MRHPITSIKNSYMPMVIERQGKNERAYDLLSRLLADRIVMLSTPINDDVATSIVGQLLFLESEDPDKDILMYVNSPGGHVTSGLGILDTMRYVSCPISTICIGQCASMGAVLLGAGTKGKRLILPHSRVMIHQPLGGASGQASDIEIQAREIKYLKDLLTDIVAESCGKADPEARAKVAADMERDYYMSAKQAVEYGLVDSVITYKKDLKPEAK